MTDTNVIDLPTTTPPKPKRQPPYVVTILNDDMHTFEYVIEVLMKVFGKSIEDAVTLTKEIHDHGQSQVWMGTRELAELKVQQVRGYGNDIYASTPVTIPLGCYLAPLPQ